MRRKHIFSSALLLTACALAPATALAFGPPAGNATPAATNPVQVAETLKQVANAQGDISPLTVKALQNDPKAMEAIGRGNPTTGQTGGQAGGHFSNPATPAKAPVKSSGKPIYGDIIIHK